MSPCYEMQSMPQSFIWFDLSAPIKYFISLNDSFAFVTYKSRTPLQTGPCTLDSYNEKIYVRMHLLLTI